MKRKETDVEINYACAFCENGELLCDDQYVLCHKKGVVRSDFLCKKFSYDPLRRCPRNDPKIELVDLEDI